MEAIFEQNDNLILFISDETHFHFNIILKQQNCCYWASKNLKQLHEWPQCSLKVTVWCAMGKTGIIFPYFLRQ